MYCYVKQQLISVYQLQSVIDKAIDQW